LIFEKSSNLIQNDHSYSPSILILEGISNSIQTLVQIRIKAETGRYD
jgi:hypothetical protein